NGLAQTHRSPEDNPAGGSGLFFIFLFAEELLVETVDIGVGRRLFAGIKAAIVDIDEGAEIGVLFELIQLLLDVAGGHGVLEAILECRIRGEIAGALAQRRPLTNECEDDQVLSPSS